MDREARAGQSGPLPASLQMEGVGPSCGLTKDHCCTGVSGAKGKGRVRAQGAPILSHNTGQTCKGYTHPRATQMHTPTQLTQHIYVN